METPTAEEYIAKARELHEDEGEIEIDHMEPDAASELAETQISRSEDSSGEIGAYVRAWVWVPRESIQPEWES